MGAAGGEWESKRDFGWWLSFGWKVRVIEPSGVRGAEGEGTGELGPLELRPTASSSSSDPDHDHSTSPDCTFSA